MSDVNSSSKRTNAIELHHSGLHANAAEEAQEPVAVWAMRLAVHQHFMVLDLLLDLRLQLSSSLCTAWKRTSNPARTTKTPPQQLQWGLLVMTSCCIMYTVHLSRIRGSCSMPTAAAMIFTQY